MITNIYRIQTRNSVYEIQVDDNGSSRCAKAGVTQTWKKAQSDSLDYLDKLCIGPGFHIPGVVHTSNVEDYNHFVVSAEPRRKAKALRGSENGIAQAMGEIVQHIKAQAAPVAIMVEDEVASPRKLAQLAQELGVPLEEVAFEGVGVFHDPITGEQAHVLKRAPERVCGVDGCTVPSIPGLPSHEGSRMCKSGSLASGGGRAHCACDACY